MRRSRLAVNGGRASKPLSRVRSPPPTAAARRFAACSIRMLASTMGVATANWTPCGVPVKTAGVVSGKTVGRSGVGVGGVGAGGVGVGVGVGGRGFRTGLLPPNPPPPPPGGPPGYRSPGVPPPVPGGFLGMRGMPMSVSSGGCGPLSPGGSSGGSVGGLTGAGGPTGIGIVSVGGGGSGRGSRRSGNPPGGAEGPEPIRGTRFRTRPSVRIATAVLMTVASALYTPRMTAATPFRTGARTF